MTKRERIEVLMNAYWWDCWLIVKHLRMTRDMKGMRLAARLILDAGQLGPNKSRAVVIREQAEATLFT
jgi:hypothetical protein